MLKATAVGLVIAARKTCLIALNDSLSSIYFGVTLVNLFFRRWLGQWILKAEIWGLDPQIWKLYKENP